MTDQFILNNTKPSLLHRIQRVGAIIEGVLWALFFFGAIFKLGNIGMGPEIMIISASSIMILYLVVPFLVLGSKGIKRHLGCYVVGPALSFAVAALLFSIEKWQGSAEMCLVAFFPCLLGLVGVTILMVLNFKWNPDDKFYILLFIRLLPATFLTAWPLLQMFH